MIPVVELLRVSTELQASEDRAGLPAQHAANVRTCALFQLEVIETVEIVESGASVASSPAMARVLEFITSGRARGIVLAEYSRLFRPDRWSDLRILETIGDHNARLYLPSGPIDLLSDSGFVEASVNNLLAAMERRRIRERMTRGKEEHRKRGAHMAGGCGIPLGLAYSKAEGWSYTADIERVKEVFRLFLSGVRSYAAIGKQLGLARSSARYILTNPIYTGWRVYDERRDLTAGGKYPSGDRRRIKRKPDEVIRVRLPLEPVIDEETFAVVQQLTQEIRSRALTRSRHADAFAYRGHLVCDSCGRPIYCNIMNGRGKNRIGNYVCSGKIVRYRGHASDCSGGWMRREMLEPVVDAALVEHLTDAGFLTDCLGAYLDAQQDAWRSNGPDQDKVAGQLEELGRRRQRVLDLYVDGAVSRQERDARLAPIDSEAAALRRMLATPARAAAGPAVRDLVGQILTTFAEWPFLDRAAKLRILDGLGAQINVGRYTVHGIGIASRLLNGQPSSDGGQSSDRAGLVYLPFRPAA